MAIKTDRSVRLSKSAIEALWQGNVVGAINLVRKERSIGMAAAKELVVTYIGTQPALKKKIDEVLATAKRRFIGWMAGVLVVAAGIAYFMIRGS
jgi:ethanolamine utilization microcompartment shell protein EutL